MNHYPREDHAVLYQRQSKPRRSSARESARRRMPLRDYRRVQTILLMDSRNVSVVVVVETSIALRRLLNSSMGYLRHV